MSIFGWISILAFIGTISSISLHYKYKKYPDISVTLGVILIISNWQLHEALGITTLVVYFLYIPVVMYVWSDVIKQRSRERAARRWLPRIHQYRQRNAHDVNTRIEMPADPFIRED